MSGKQKSREMNNSSESLDLGLEPRKFSNSQFMNAPCTGYLREREKGKLGMETWNKAYYMLSDRVMYKLNTSESKESKNYFSIFQTKVVDYDKSSGRQNSFSIFFQDGKQRVYSAKSFLDKEKWMNTINQYSGTSEKISHESVLHSLNHAGIGSDKNGIIKVVNNHALALFGYKSKDDLLNKNVNVLMSDSLHKPHDKLIEKYNETGIKSLIGNIRTVQAKHSDGSIFPVEISLGETTDENMKFTAVFRPLKKQNKKKQDINPVLLTPSSKEIHDLKKELDKQLDLFIHELGEITKDEFNELKKIINEKVENHSKRKKEIEKLSIELDELRKTSKNLRNELNLHKQGEIPTMLDILKNERTNGKFLEYCILLKCEQIVMFWNEVEIFKTSKMNLVQKAKYIHETYLNSKNKFLIGEKLLVDVESQLNSPKNDLFNLVQKEALEKMENFFYKTFCDTAIGKEVIEYLQLE
eukprot:gene1440-12059_t